MRLMQGKLSRQIQNFVVFDQAQPPNLLYNGARVICMKVPELKKYLQVIGVSVANKCREELLDLCQKAHKLAVKVIDEQEDLSTTSNNKRWTRKDYS